MYFDFWDNRPDTPRLSSPMTPREKGFATVIVHLLLVILMLVWPEIPWVKQAEARRQEAIEEAARLRMEEQRENARFVFVQPRVEMPAPPPPRADLSDLDRRAASIVKPPDPRNSMPFNRGNSPERVDADAMNGPRAQPEPPPPGGAEAEAARELPPVANATNGMSLPKPQPETARPGPRGPSTGVLADAIRNVQKYVGQEAWNNPQGGAPHQDMPSIQFDTKGVEFGPWLRRFVAQIRRNWFIPYAAMTMKGHVVVTFNVHKDGRITDLQVMKPSSVSAFTNSAHNAIAASNPTVPLPPEYPDNRAFFTVTFYFNENPDR
jgi:TonB family protein